MQSPRAQSLKPRFLRLANLAPSELSIPPLLLAVLVIAALLAGCVSAQTGRDDLVAARGNLTVYFSDVGQGDSALAIFNNFSILVDAGTADSTEETFRTLRMGGDDNLDLVVATHPDSDHIGGLPKVLAVTRYEQVWDAGLEKDTRAYREYSKAVSGGRLAHPVRGDNLEVSGGLFVRVLNPKPGEFNDSNSGGIVLLLEYRKVRILLAADCTYACEESLRDSGLLTDVQVLKVAHHGSKYSTLEKFLEITRPEIAVVSVGKENTYGHPSPDTLLRLEGAGARVFRTDLDGTIGITTDGESVLSFSP